MDSIKRFRYLRERQKILKAFRIPITPEITSRIEELYPNEIAIENYMVTLILKFLDRYDELKGIYIL